MTETEFLIAEVRQLRGDVARLHAGVAVRHSWMKLFLKDLSTNPHTQYTVHKWGAIYWLINFPLICCLSSPRTVVRPCALRSRQNPATQHSSSHDRRQQEHAL